MNLTASSIGRRAADCLQPGVSGRVLASFRQVCDLVMNEGAVAALAQNGFERGPMTILLEPNAAGDLSTHLVPGAPFDVGTRELWLSGSRSQKVRVDLSGATSWAPGLPWDALQLRSEEIQNSARILLHVVTGNSLSGAGLHWESRLRQAVAEVLEARRRGNRDALRTAIRGLCGLGEGLTPQGDDWLAGWLLGMRLAEPMDGRSQAGESLGALVLDAATGRTTLLSQAFLVCAAAGEAAESWHLLLNEMARRPAEKFAIERATRRILSHGATSGAAMLEGFLAGLGAVQGR